MAHIVLEIKGSTVHLDRDEAERILRELQAILTPAAPVASAWTSTHPGGGWAAPKVTTGEAPARDKYPTVVCTSDLFEERR